MNPIIDAKINILVNIKRFLIGNKKNKYKMAKANPVTDRIMKILKIKTKRNVKEPNKESGLIFFRYIK